MNALNQVAFEFSSANVFKVDKYQGLSLFNVLPNNTILDWSKFKVLPYDKINDSNIYIFLSKGI